MIDRIIIIIIDLNLKIKQFQRGWVSRNPEIEKELTLKSELKREQK